MSLKLEKISKTFNINGFFLRKNSLKVLDNIDLELLRGDILGLLGKNGSGKTTMFKIILDLIEPSNGKVTITDRKNKYLAYINTNSRSFYWRISPKDNLTFYGKLLNMKNNEIEKNIIDLSKKFDVFDLLDTPFMKLSSGQMQTFIIVRSLLKKPDIVFFDEATSSMDFQRSINVLKSIKNYINKYKIPTIWCSHDLDEVDFLCNRFSILKKGNLKFLSKDDFKELKHRTISYCFEILKKDLAKLPNDLKYELVSDFRNTYLIHFQDKSESLNDSLKVLIENKIEIKKIVNRKNMRDFSLE